MPKRDALLDQRRLENTCYVSAIASGESRAGQGAASVQTIPIWGCPCGEHRPLPSRAPRSCPFPAGLESSLGARAAGRADERAQQCHLGASPLVCRAPSTMGKLGIAAESFLERSRGLGWVYLGL